ncbi:hypothetical protein [Paenibacillus soyae]|uniref:Uncharacterized protein n=1 Tax=Paenibacillus soyae TaxID=2969249 RepID=A0A9X2SDB5_9BACL|nr:hypothetical protein [Paenibacillus soyae]MCR2806932.1 hypothetical protein [Paenibacillus soyae]
MDQEKEIAKLKERVAELEQQQSRSKPKSSHLARFGIGFMITFVVLLVLIGLFQFINPSG